MPCAHRSLHSFPTRRSSDLRRAVRVHHRPGRRDAMSEPALAPKEGAARVACWVTLLVSTALYFRADHVWRECGYDCAIFGERSEEHTSELQSQSNLVCRLLL